MGKSWSFDLLYYFGVTSADNGERVEQLGLDIDSKMHITGVFIDLKKLLIQLIIYRFVKKIVLLY